MAGANDAVRACEPELYDSTAQESRFSLINPFRTERHDLGRMPGGTWVHRTCSTYFGDDSLNVMSCKAVPSLAQALTSIGQHIEKDAQLLSSIK